MRTRRGWASIVKEKKPTGKRAGKKERRQKTVDEKSRGLLPSMALLSRTMKHSQFRKNTKVESLVECNSDSKGRNGGSRKEKKSPARNMLRAEKKKTADRKKPGKSVCS